MRKLCFIDLETGGVNSSTDAVLQIAGIIDIDGVVKEEFDFKCQPFNGDIVNDAALEVNKITRQDIIDKHLPAVFVHRQLVSMLSKYVNKYDKKDKMFFTGYNCSMFDAPFLRRFFEKAGDKYFGSLFWFPTIDVAVLAGHVLMDERTKMERFNLESVCKHTGVETSGEMHDAMVDIKATRDLYYKLLKR